MGVTERVYFSDQERFSSMLDADLPSNAFHPASLDILYSSEGLDELQQGGDDRIIDFISDFLDCDCDEAPFCGHPEVKFIHYLMELRREGYEPGGMVDRVESDYGLFMYPGDVLEFLDSSVRNLEAIEEIAETLGENDISEGARDLQRDLIE